MHGGAVPRGVRAPTRCCATGAWRSLVRGPPRVLVLVLVRWCRVLDRGRVRAAGRWTPASTRRADQVLGGAWLLCRVRTVLRRVRGGSHRPSSEGSRRRRGCMVVCTLF